MNSEPSFMKTGTEVATRSTAAPMVALGWRSTKRHGPS